MNIVAFIFKNIRWIALAFALLTGTTLLWNGIQYIRDSAKNEVIVEVLNGNNKLLNEVIEANKNNQDFISKVTEIQDEQQTLTDEAVDKLRNDYTKIMSEDMGPNTQNQAPESLKQLVRRISGE